MVTINTKLAGTIISNVDKNKANAISSKSSKRSSKDKVMSLIDQILAAANEGEFSLTTRLNSTTELNEITKFLRQKKFVGATVSYHGKLYIKVYWGPNKQLRRDPKEETAEENALTPAEWKKYVGSAPYINEKGVTQSQKWKPI